MESAYEYIGPYAKVGALDLGSDAPAPAYAFATAPCAGGDCASQDLAALQKVVSVMPVAICLDADPWDDYVGGVMKASACSSAARDVDHCVQLVGFNAEADEPYWIVRNSWTTDWGMDGFIHLQFDENTCGVANEALVAASITGTW